MSGDRGARVSLALHPELVTEVPCDDVADPADVDTMEDLLRLERELGAPRGGRTIGQRRS
jgi:CTP:molybdopterin cytidylyltransferase MocA